MAINTEAPGKISFRRLWAAVMRQFFFSVFLCLLFSRVCYFLLFLHYLSPWVILSFFFVEERGLGDGRVATRLDQDIQQLCVCLALRKKKKNMATGDVLPKRGETVVGEGKELEDSESKS